MDTTIHGTLLPYDDPDVSLAVYRGAPGLEVRDGAASGGTRWITVGLADQPGLPVRL